MYYSLCIYKPTNNIMLSPESCVLRYLSVCSRYHRYLYTRRYPARSLFSASRPNPRRKEKRMGRCRHGSSVQPPDHTHPPKHPPDQFLIVKEEAGCRPPPCMIPHSFRFPNLISISYSGVFYSLWWWWLYDKPLWTPPLSRALRLLHRSLFRPPTNRRTGALFLLNVPINSS